MNEVNGGGVRLRCAGYFLAVYLFFPKYFMAARRGSERYTAFGNLVEFFQNSFKFAFNGW